MSTDIILDSQDGSITFIVDRDLPEPEDHIESVLTPMEIAEDSLWEWGKPTVYATSKCDEGLYDIGADTFYQTLLTAYAEHRPVVISPDMIWCLICQGFSHHINLDPEKYREKLVFHQGKDTLEVKRGESEEFTPEQWEDIIREFAEMVDEKTRGSVASAIVTDFSTTTPVEAISSRITLLDTVKSYFEFVVIQMICGIPHITLKGTPKDWQKIADNIQDFRQFDLDWWIDSLSPILEEFVKAANGYPVPSLDNLRMPQEYLRTKAQGDRKENTTPQGVEILTDYQNEVLECVRKRNIHLRIQMSEAEIGFDFLLFNFKFTPRNRKCTRHNGRS